MCITRHVQRSSEALDLKPAAQWSDNKELKKDNSMLYRGEYLVFKREPYHRRRGGGMGGSQTGVVESHNGRPKVVDDVDATTAAFYSRDNSIERSRSSLAGAAASQLTASESVRDDSLSSPSSSLHNPTSLTHLLLFQDANKARILHEYEELRDGGKREAAARCSASSMNVSNIQASSSVGQNGPNSLKSRQSLLELEIERLEIEYARNEFL